jgi:hypothetical protein
MLDAIVRSGHDATRDGELLREIAIHGEALLASAKRGDTGLVDQAERAVQQDARVFVFDADGGATLTAAGHAWSAGRFEPVSIGALRARASEARGRAAPAASPRVRLWVIEGATTATDIGSLQATAGEGALFQVASQFNCLESPGPFVTPVVHYLTDPTQGPRASISAFPGTLLRHYAARGPDGERFVQSTDGPQIELLGDVCGPEVGRACNGYLMADGVPDPRAFVEALEARFDTIKVGLHDGVEVVLGSNWSGSVQGRPRIAQVFTSTVAAGGYGGEALGPHFEPACRHLLRAAYLGTLLGAVTTGKTKVVLTLIGGGVFGNPIAVIWEAIVWAIAQAEPLLSGDLDVLVNGRDLSHRLPRERVLAPVRASGGAMIVFDRANEATIVR